MHTCPARKKWQSRHVLNSCRRFCDEARNDQFSKLFISMPNLHTDYPSPTSDPLLIQYDEHDLALIELAVKRILQTENDNASKRDLDVLQPSNNGNDFQLLTKLLHQVQSLRALRVQRQDQEKPPSKNKLDKELFDALAEVARTTTTVATVAETAATVIVQHAEAVKTFARLLNAAGDCDDSLKQIKSKETTDIGKAIQKQNRITHWMLGFLIVSTALWRFKEISIALKIRSIVSNPVQYIGSIFSNGVKSPQNGDAEGLRLPQIDVPSVLKTEESEKVDNKKGNPFTQLEFPFMRKKDERRGNTN